MQTFSIAVQIYLQNFALSIWTTMASKWSRKEKEIFFEKLLVTFQIPLEM